MKIVVLDGYLVNHDHLNWEVKEKFPDLTWYDTCAPEEIIPRIGDAQAVFVNRAPLSRKVFEACKDLRYVGVLGTGTNAIDTVAAKEHGVTVCNVAGYSTNAVTQVVFSLLLEIMGNISPRIQYVKEGGWTQFRDPKISEVPMFEIAGKTLGIIGMGEIGYAVAKVAMAFGMEVLANRRHPDRALECEHLRFVDLDTLYRESDIITIHCPLTPETSGMINRDAISKMKDGVVLLNTSRGPVLNEQDVSDALDSGKIYRAGVDVLAVEPPKADNPLLKNPRCLITPHVGWTPRETRMRLLELSADCFFSFLEGKPKNVVNP